MKRGSAFRAFQAELRGLVGDESVRAAEAEYGRLLSGLIAANDRRDGRLRALYRFELREVCPSGTLTAAIEPCQRDLEVHEH